MGNSSYSEEEKDIAKGKKARFLEKINETEGKLRKEADEDNKLMHSSNEEREIESGKLINDAINNSIGSFMPDLMFKNITKNYHVAKQIYGESFIRELTGYDPGYLEKNIKVPEFKKELKKKIDERIKNLKQKKLIDHEGRITLKGYELASLVLYIEELDKLTAKGMRGTKYHKKPAYYGEIDKEIAQKKRPKYREIDFRRTIRLAIRRLHKTIDKKDWVNISRKSRGEIHIVLGIDASGSMKGEKIAACKRAATALAYNATAQKDKVGLIVFGSEVKEILAPTNNFNEILSRIIKVKASRETDYASTIDAALNLFTFKNITKHLILISDVMPTVGKDPYKKTINAISKAKEAGISVSIVGIELNEKGVHLAKEIAAIGGGKFYVVKTPEDLDTIILEDYYKL